MCHLKDLCNEFQVKTSSTKAILIGELVTIWKRQNVGESSAGPQILFASTVDIKTIYNRLGEGSVLTLRFYFHACLQIPYQQLGERVRSRELESLQISESIQVLCRWSCYERVCA